MLMGVVGIPAPGNCGYEVERMEADVMKVPQNGIDDEAHVLGRRDIGSN